MPKEEPKEYKCVMDKCQVTRLGLKAIKVHIEFAHPMLKELLRGDGRIYEEANRVKRI